VEGGKSHFPRGGDSLISRALEERKRVKNQRKLADENRGRGGGGGGGLFKAKATNVGGRRGVGGGFPGMDQSAGILVSVS
jgi:hypothetical protein